jgi:hypothetical protein
MKIKKTNRQSPKKVLLVLASLVIVAAIGYGVVSALRFTNTQPSNDELTTSNDRTSSVKEDQVEGSDEDGQLPSRTPTNSDSDPNNVYTKNTVLETPTIARAEQSGSLIKVVGTFQRTTQGSCLAVFTNNGVTVTKESPITIAPANHTCSFSFNSAELSTPGDWRLELGSVLNDEISESATVTISTR